MVMLGRAFKNFFMGTPPKDPLREEAIEAGKGAYGQAADYYRSNLSNNPADFDAYANPEIRRYNEQIIPGLAEQYAGIGSGALDSSWFRNATQNAGVDLSERLAQIRANLRQQSAQGLYNIAQAGRGQTEPGTEGFGTEIAPLAVAAGTAYFSGGNPAATAGAYQATKSGQNYLLNRFSGQNSKSSPYGNSPYANPVNTNAVNYGNGILNSYGNGMKAPQSTLGIMR